MTNGNILRWTAGGSASEIRRGDQQGALLPGSVGEAAPRADESPERSMKPSASDPPGAGDRAADRGLRLLPRPFDYTEGVFRLKHKFQALYGCLHPAAPSNGRDCRPLPARLRSYILGEVSDGTLPGDAKSLLRHAGHGLDFP